MPGKFHHEQLYRGTLARAEGLRVTLCGAGALGSHLADNLLRQGFRQVRVIDRDRVEEHNVGTQLYVVADVGAWKVDVLRNQLFRATGIEIETQNKELTDRTAGKFLKQSGLVLDTFDNSTSRRLVAEHCAAENIPCLHVGLFEDYCEVVWNPVYRIPADGGADVCDYPLARNLVLLAVSLATETLWHWLLHDQLLSRSATLRDFRVQELEAPAQ